MCYRLWEEAGTGALEPFARPEILSADLGSLVLDCAAWGVADPARLAFLDAPPAPAVKEARALLGELGALDAAGRITEMGRRLRALPLPPRLARMVLAAAEHGPDAAREAAEIAAVLVERALGGDAVDLAERLDRFRRDRSGRAQDMRRLAQGWARLASPLPPSGRGRVREADRVRASADAPHPDPLPQAGEGERVRPRASDNPSRPRKSVPASGPARISRRTAKPP